MYLDANKLYGWVMSEKLPIGGYTWSNDHDRYTSEFIKNYNENSNLRYLFEVDIEYPQHLHEIHSHLPFLSEKKEKLLATLNDKENCVVHICALKPALTRRLTLKKIHRVIKFRQEGWLKPYIDKNTKLRKEAKNEFEKNFFKLMNNAVFGKMMENVRNHREVKLIVSEVRRKKLASEPNYHSCKIFSGYLMAIEMRKTSVFMDKPIPVGQAILDISEALMYKLWYDYLKPQYQDKVKLCYMVTDSFIFQIETEEFYKDIVNDVNEWFDTSKYTDQGKWPFSIGLNKKEIG